MRQWSCHLDVGRAHERNCRMTHYIPDATDDTATELVSAPIESDKAKQFLFAGNARFTIRSLRTYRRYTYRISTPNRKTGPWFCSLLTGSDNEGDYRYFGQFFGTPENGLKYVHGKPGKACASRSAESTVAFVYVLQHILDCGELPPRVEVWHEGRCGRCGRVLTVPESIESGFGPECINKLGE